MGVTIFFVLSGFILTVSYGGAFRNPSTVKIWNFGVARVARVYPTYLLVLAYAVGLTVQSGGNLDHLTRHVLALQAWSDSNAVIFKFNAPGWSIGVEFFLYACFPLLIVLLGRALEDSWVDCLLVAAAVQASMGVAVLLRAHEGARRGSVPECWVPLAVSNAFPTLGRLHARHLRCLPVHESSEIARQHDVDGTYVP